MKNKKEEVMKKQNYFIKAGLAALTLAALGLVTVPHDAEASTAGTAGNAVIRNSGTLSYNDKVGTAQAPQYFGVDVTVLTVAAAPTVTFSPSPGSTDGTGATQVYNVKVRTNSNGPGTFAFASTDQTQVNMALSATGPSAVTGFSLGSTMYDSTNSFAATGALSTGTTLAGIKVPHDGTVAGSTTTINGLTTTSTVYVTDGSSFYGPFTVSAINLPALPALVTTSTIAAVPVATISLTAQGSISSFTPNAGWMIVEEQTKTVTVTQGLVTVATDVAHWDTKFDATMTNGVGSSVTGTAIATTNAHKLALTVKKYSRNTAAVCTTGITVTFNSSVYCDAGVTGKPADTIEYLILITNAGTGDATIVKAADAVPPYTTLVPTGSDFATIYDNSGGSANVPTGNTSTIGYGALTGTSMAFDLGNPSTLGSGGTIPKAADSTTPTKWYVKYQVKVN